MTKQPRRQRDCGTCRECCVTCPVETLEKPAFTPCSKLNPDADACGACTIYDQRPNECAAYECAWLVGEFGDEDRPDKSRILFEHTHLSQDGASPGPVVLLGMIIDKAPTAAQFLQYARRGVVVSIAGADQDDHLEAGHPVDLMEWHRFLQRARHDGFERMSGPGENMQIKVGD